MSDLKAKFEDAVNYVKNATGDFQPSNDLKLQMYALFKQGSDGDVKGKKPGMMDLVGKAKYQAWEKLKGLSPDEAMQKYVDLVEDMKKKHG